MKLIYTHENKLLVENARNILQIEGIETVMKNEFSSGAAGDLAPMDTWPELWLVDEAQLAKAKELMNTMEAQANEADWRCNQCQEINGAAFEICWSCGSPA
ncbi:DUF2007 domain-containing protein [Idiomarina sp. HP20-50]|uniref:putative signal transducing protein n=1 Tax=Idiomarina sp. HP20-50 TaxID=3070813 RepID=UPI00294B83E1|nr:DUF2007 domain-containing protein [Idiomarina sp. HP20-50]MDV6315288.1 DUF2007 domain-containing protein [Idiomarina sp. HP20-50]